MKSKIECQECGAEISVPEDAVVGEIITCPDCGGEYMRAGMTKNVERGRDPGRGRGRGRRAVQRHRASRPNRRTPRRPRSCPAPA